MVETPRDAWNGTARDFWRALEKYAQHQENAHDYAVMREVLTAALRAREGKPK